ncbi:unnamed protein product [Mytilus edulis]|uniref:Pao retrotransposon peptidase n=1 Tax=Mytilus edulis TaxID=6550 RepID=A0A8S3S8E5_MYTED|nr:unnamed protein product [Mytilus edulis]
MDSKPKAVRAGHKSAVKRLLRKTEDDSNLDNEESAELLETLIQKQKIISALDEDIMNSLKEEDIEEDILNADEYKFFSNTKIRPLRKTFAIKLCTDNDIPQHDHALPSHTFENINQHSSVPYTTQMYPKTPLLVLDTDKEAKILGMRWNVDTDELSYAKRVLPSVSSNITKREILKESSKLFDPLGFLSPVSIRTKILMQDLWKERYDWDEPLPENLQLQWKDLAKDIGIVTSMKLPRQYFTGNTNSRSLHVFVDASMKAYGAVAYMYLSKGHSAALVMAKTRVAPVKKLTLPQLEIMAAVIGVRLTQHLKSTLECTDVTLWSDSQIVLQWLNTSKPLKRFVSNRIKEINELTEECKWKYCPTNCNPADLLTRGIIAKQFMESVLWKTGPTCLIQNSTNLETHIPINTALSVLADDN